MTGDRFNSFLRRLVDDAAILPHQLDLITDRVLLIDLPIPDQSAASFLDQRALKPNTSGAWFEWTQFEAACAPLAQKAPPYILHIGHCGSTLASRLLESASGVRALREPLPLRTLAFDAADALNQAALLTPAAQRSRLRDLEKIWARGGSFVKATSICNVLADKVSDDSPLAFMYLKPEPYIATLLAGANAIADMRGFAQMRYRRLASFTEIPEALSTFSAGKLAALAWLVETATIASSGRSAAHFDFEALLASPVEQLRRIGAALRLSIPAGAAEQAVAGPLMRQYAKAPEHAYDAGMRTTILAEARRDHGEEIRVGLRWLEDMAARSAAGAAALHRFSA